MAQLADLRYPVSIQGLLALVNCLPTDYAHYDKLLPRWVDLWIGRNNRYNWCIFANDEQFFLKASYYPYVETFFILMIPHSIHATVAAWTTTLTGTTPG